jgi:hypothetical protein
MKALISPLELIQISEDKIGQRIAEVVKDDEIFDVCSPLHWLTCPDDCNPNDWYFYEDSFAKLTE